MKEEEGKVIRTFCSRMDHGGCSLLIVKKNGKVVDIKPDKNGPISKGYICPKAIASKEKLEHPDRLRAPLLRKGPKGRPEWEELTWERALDLIAERFLEIKRQYGPEAVAFCHGMPKGLDLFVMIRLANLFGSPNVVMIQDVCHAPREIGGLYTCGFYPVADLHSPSGVVILWGSHLPGTNEEGQICKLFFEKYKKGAMLIVVDPVLHSTIKDKVHLFLQIRPGTDSALALSMINIIISEGFYDKEFVNNWCYGFEELKAHVQKYSPEAVSKVVDIEPKLIYEAAKAYATLKPGCILWGNAIEQTKDNFSTIRSLIILMALTGNLDVPGGNIQPVEPKVTRLGEFVKNKLIPDKAKRMISAYYGVIPRLMTVSPAYFRKAVLEGIPYPVKAAYFQCTNPLITWPDSNLTERALKKLDFTVVSDVYLTPTTLYADIVLPAATQFEFNDIGHYGLGHGFILARPKIVDPPLYCWPDIKILNELGKRLTDSQYWYEDHEDLLREVIAPTGLDLKEFMEIGILKGDMEFKKYERQGFKTPTGKVELVLSKAEGLNIDPLPVPKTGLEQEKDYPLSLTSMKEPLFLHSSYRWIQSLRRLQPFPQALLNPRTAKIYQIKEGQHFLIETPYGSISHRARFSTGVKEGVVVVKHGWWFPEYGIENGYVWKEANINMLTSVSELGREFATPQLRGIPCRIRPR